MAIAVPRMIEQSLNLWRTGLSALLAAETEQSALGAVVTTVAEMLGGPAVGVLRGRADYLSSVAAFGQDRYVAPLFVEALLGADARIVARQRRHQELFAGRRVVTIPLRDESKVLGAVSALLGDKHGGHESAYIAILELAFIRTVQRIRRIAETRLLYEISLRLGSTLDLPQLLHEVVALAAHTFVATTSRIFLYDERAGDLVMTPGPEIQPSPAAALRVPLEGTIAGRVVREGEPLICNDQPVDGRPLAEIDDVGVACKLICVPLKQSDRTLGALMLINQRDRPDFLDEDLRLLTTIAGTIAMMIVNARLYRRAIRDALTGAYNRGAFDNALLEYWNRWKTTHEGFALILLDLDDFKQINDHFGHLTGDTVLQTVTRLLWETLREDDNIYRYGGEEFGILLGNVTDPAIAATIAERLRAALDRELTISNLVTVKISASLGVALHPLHGATSSRALLDMADEAAYEGKRGGKNRVVVAPLSRV
ncbi:MAG: sensor domain-containing diguanylate cyclase [Kouleothrix sp.]|nr:sensor domain-containing diguanylate cyclase [Kouleothrix sp.]